MDALIEQLPTSQLINWMAYLQLRDERDMARQVEALSIVAAKLFEKQK